ncbi:unnamed protein product, partial [Polarella glacialis]
PANALQRCQSIPVLALVVGPPAVILAAARSAHCLLLALPGLVWLCLPVCIWMAAEIHKLWLYWDGRIQFVEDWPALALVRSSLVVLTFAVSLGTLIFAVGCSILGFQEWDAKGSCPF